jgi:electron transport complex protein RnfG
MMKEAFRMCFVLTVIGAACAALMAFVNAQTREPIERNAGGAKLDATAAVMPPCDNDVAADTLVLNDGSRDVKFHRGRMKGVPVGAAFSVVAPDGYSGDIEILVGVDTAGVVTGLMILKHLETPGLGSKIETPGFRDQYVGKSVRSPETWAVEKDGGVFKQITGATISSRAVTNAVAAALVFFDAHRAEIFGGTRAGGDGGASNDGGGT